MDDIKRFTAVLDRVRAGSVEALHDAQKVLAFQAQERVMDLTPVGNPDLWKVNVGTGRVGNADRVRGDYDYVGQGYVGGHARRNWQVTISDPADNELDGVDADGLTTRLVGQAVIKTAPQFSAIWISNNVPYIERLEHGHSTQSPQGMLEVTFHDIASTYSSAVGNALRKRRL